MTLDVYVESTLIKVQIPPEVLEQGGDFFAMMDRDMDQGWRMGPEYVENPDPIQRAQIAASKMLVAIDNKNRNVVNLMAGYIVSRVPSVTAVHIATDGDLTNTEIVTE